MCRTSKQVAEGSSFAWWHCRASEGKIFGQSPSHRLAAAAGKCTHQIRAAGMGVMSKPRRAGYARDLADVVARVAGDYARDKRLCTAVAVGFTGLAAYAHYTTSQPAIA